MESYSIKNLTFTYPMSDTVALDNISLTIGKGDFVTLCGASGSGKTTFLRHLKSRLTPHGTQKGDILFEGKKISEVDYKIQASKIGFVMQDPDNQIVTDKVWHELAFGLESLGKKSEEIRLRVGEMASYFGIQDWFYKNVWELSGGQKQLLNLASVMVMDPGVLILDEPTAQLDPIAASNFINEVYKINRDFGITVIITEHRLEEVLPLSDRVVVMEKGRVVFDECPSKVTEKLSSMAHEMFLSMPTPMRIHASVENNLPVPITIREGREWLSQIMVGRQFHEVENKKELQHDKKDVILKASDLWFRYEKEQQDIVKGLTFEVNKGEVFAILGANGAGKTTAINLMGGLLAPYRGKIKSKAQNTAILPQNPQDLFVKKSVREDLVEALEDHDESIDVKIDKVMRIAEVCGLIPVLEKHPYDISGGEQQRAALAKILLREPDMLVLDEPTKGMDGQFKKVLGNILTELKITSIAVIMVSHDVEFCAQYADRCALFFDGRLLAEGEPDVFFTENRFYTTAAVKMSKGILPGVVTAEDVIRALGGEPKETKPKVDENKRKAQESKKNKCEMVSKAAKSKPFDFFSVTITLLAVPFTILMGLYLFDDRKYYFISLLVLLEAMLPFALDFERQKKEVRELVILAVLCAIGVVARGAFFMIPQFKPVAALIIITGVSFGGRAGFLVGSATVLLSNFFFGQGPWTPWQMFALGTIGFLSGILAQKGWLKSDTRSLCIFGAVATFFIYGGLMNPASILIFQGQPTFKMFMAAYIYGIPFDLIHAASTAVILYFIAKPMLEKLDRIKIKYGFNL